MDRLHNIKSFLFFGLLIPIILATQIISKASDYDLVLDDSKEFYVDVVAFRSDSLSKTQLQIGRVDVYAIVPYQTLNFIHSNNVFASKFQILTTISTTDDGVISQKSVERSITTDSYFESQGGTAKFDYSQVIFNLVPGEYKVKSTLVDEFQNVNYESSRTISIIDYSKYDFALSGILLLSSIEEKNGRYKITPHISDNIGALKDGYFIFFEAYNQKDSADIPLVFQFINEDDEIVFTSEPIIKHIKQGKNQLFIRIPKLSVITSGKYKLKLIALNPSFDTSNYSEKDYIAVTQRTLQYEETISGYVIKDIETSIRQLALCASNEEKNYIDEAKDLDEKRKRFEDFWKEKDPSPNTENNEAFLEYYSRIAFSNKNFKSYSDGWLTDRGRVYIVLGEPMTREKQYSNANGAYFEIWTYANNRQFIFVDVNGFGDYRLSNPASFYEKYQYIK